MSTGLNIDLRQLNTFVMVADTGSFSRASEKLFVAQPALSRQIRMLESALNVQVFVRHGRGVVLTAAGELLYERASKLLRDIEQTEADVSAVAGKVTGQVALGILPTTAHALIGSIVEGYRRGFPQVKLAVKSAMSGTLQQMVVQHRLNIAISYMPSNQRNVRCWPLLEEPLFLVGPADSPFAKRKEVTVEEVLHQDLVLPEEKQGLRMMMEQEAARLGISIRLALEVSAWPLLTDTARRGLGYSILPFAAVHDMVNRGEVVALPIVSPELARKLVLITPADRPASVATRKLADMIRQQVSLHVRQGAWKGRPLFDQDNSDPGVDATELG